jgi:hypothetical protein
MTDEFIMILAGCLMILLGILLIIYLAGAEKPTTRSGKSARGQLIVITVTLILCGLILIAKYS